MYYLIWDIIYRYYLILVISSRMIRIEETHDQSMHEAAELSLKEGHSNCKNVTTLLSYRFPCCSSLNILNTSSVSPVTSWNTQAQFKSFLHESTVILLTLVASWWGGVQTTIKYPWWRALRIQIDIIWDYTIRNKIGFLQSQ